MDSEPLALERYGATSLNEYLLSVRLFLAWTLTDESQSLILDGLRRTQWIACAVHDRFRAAVQIDAPLDIT